jgi:hypothetical protein
MGTKPRPCNVKGEERKRKERVVSHPAMYKREERERGITCDHGHKRKFKSEKKKEGFGEWRGKR